MMLMLMVVDCDVDVDVDELNESGVNGTNFWNMFDDPIEQTNRTDSTQTEEDRAIHQNRFDWDRNLTREDFSLPSGERFYYIKNFTQTATGGRSEIIEKTGI